MSRVGDFSGSGAGDFIQSLVLERNMKPGVPALVYVAGNPTGSPLYAQADHDAFPALFTDHHYHRAQIDADQSFHFGRSVTTPTVPNIGSEVISGLYARSYFRFRGVCSLVPRSEIFVDQTAVDMPLIGPHITLTGPGDGTQFIPLIRTPYKVLITDALDAPGVPKGDWYYVDDDHFYGASINPVVLNMSNSESIPEPGPRYIDRIVAVSTRTDKGWPFNATMRLEGGHYAFPFQWWVGGIGDGYYIVDPITGQKPGGGFYDFGTRINQIGTLYVGTRQNPQKLDGSGVMLPASITTAHDGWHVAECEYIGSVNEDGPREEEYFDLVPPDLL